MSAVAPSGDEPGLRLGPAPDALAAVVAEARRAARHAGARNLYAVQAATPRTTGVLLVCNVRGRAPDVGREAVAAVRSVVADHRVDGIRVIASSDLPVERHVEIAKVDARAAQAPYPFSGRETWLLIVTLIASATLTLWSRLAWVLLGTWLLVALGVAGRRGARVPGVAPRGSARPVGWLSLVAFAVFVFATWWILLTR